MSRWIPSRPTCVGLLVLAISLPLAGKYLKLLGPFIVVVYLVLFAVCALWRIKPWTLNDGPEQLDDSITTLGDLGSCNASSDESNQRLEKQ